MVKSTPGGRFVARDITALRRRRGRAGGQTGGRRAEFAGLKLMSGVTVEMTGTTANSFTNTRMRGMGRDVFSRRLMRETQQGIDWLIYPMFVVEERVKHQPVASMPGIE